MGLRERNRALDARRVQRWQGRLSPDAAVRSLRCYELMLLAYLLAIGFLLLAGLSSVLAPRPVTIVVIVLTFAAPATCFSAALLLIRTVGHEVARQYGLPANSWRHLRVKTPEQFDSWLASVQPERRPPADGSPSNWGS